ncbi:MAG TPA: ArsB/NhaD family transporter [Desulfitobacteriaceae bacterium]|nr:ArsB/NhaD family transporter [Desulfitobacteriaceae bacterium]
MNSNIIIAIVIFLVTYALILSEKLHRAVIALAGGMLVIILGVIEQKEAIESIDFNTIGLLIGMMIIVGITRRSGVFEFLAIKAAKLAKGDPWHILLFLSIITAVLSGLLDNVTTVLLIVPVTFAITAALNLNPVPFLVTQILASNIGGTATLIGDPPNIMIGSATELGFIDFIINLTIPVIVVFIVTMLIIRIIYRKDLITEEALKADIMNFEENNSLKDRALLKKSLIVLVLTILGFILHQSLHLESATVALSGAALLLLITREEPEDILLAVEWPTIFFFAGLFILVGSLEQVGILKVIAQKSIEATGGSLFQISMMILWLSAIVSAFLDNIPFTATIIPLIQSIGQLGGIENLNPVWWSLSLGACLGGNGTLIGASANVIVAGIAEKNGSPLSFRGYLKIAFPLMILSIVISSAYLYLRYFAF